MNIIAFAASNSRTSINQQLVRYATSKVKGATVDLVDLNDYEMPIYSQDREAESGIPSQAHTLFEKIAKADAVVISFAEHNGSYTAAYKNIFDWMSRIDMKVFQSKKGIYLATSPGPGGATTVLNSAVTSAPYFGVDLLAHFSLANFFEMFDVKQQKISDTEKDDELTRAMATLA